MTVYWLEQAAFNVPSDDDWLCPLERAHLGGLRFPKRRSDWRLGRWTAKNAVAATLDLLHTTETLAGIEIRAAESGAPEVFLGVEPAAISISLSHRAGVAAGLVGPSGIKLGCDLEIIEPRSQAFLDDYFTEAEREVVARSPIVDRDKFINLFWSAKESALKALRQGLRLDTRSLTVSLANGLSSTLQEEPDHFAIATRHAPFEATQWQPLQVACDSGEVFSGWWRQENLFLHTMVACPTVNCPVLLVLP